MNELQIERLVQSNESTCGPAVIRMLLNHFHISVTEKDIVQASGVGAMLKQNGTRIDQLAKSVTTLSQELKFYYKEEASIEDIVKLIHEYNVPVGIDWQGLFWDTLLEEARLSTHIDHGHYAIVTDISPDDGTITILDPFYAFKDLRIFPVDWFKTRWWDIADTNGSDVKEDISYYTTRLIFVVVPKNATFLKSVGLQSVSDTFFYEKIEKAKKSLQYHPRSEPKGLKRKMLHLTTKINRVMMSFIKY